MELRTNLCCIFTFHCIKVRIFLKNVVKCTNFHGFFKKYNSSNACFWGGGISREDCEDFEKNDAQCEDLYQGRMQAMELSVELYKVVNEFDVK